MARDDAHFRLRLPTDLKKYVSDAAQENHRSINGEVVHILRQHQKTASAPTA